MSDYAIRIFPSVQKELDAAMAAEARGEFFTSSEHLQRAHVLAQPSTFLHVRIHWCMFQFAARNRLNGEAFGQLWRTFAAALFTALKLVPTGNSGGADVSGFHRMAVAAELQAIMDAARV